LEDSPGNGISFQCRLDKHPQGSPSTSTT
jgi:hypothetical protein